MSRRISFLDFAARSAWKEMLSKCSAACLQRFESDKGVSLSARDRTEQRSRCIKREEWALQASEYIPITVGGAAFRGEHTGRQQSFAVGMRSDHSKHCVL